MSKAQQTANNSKSVKLDTQIENREKSQIMQKFAEPESSGENQLECDFDYSKYVEHPSIATYPKMGEEEFLGFIEDVQMNGQIDAIVINEKNEIIDGRSRYEACKITGQIPHFKLYDDIEDNIQLYWVSKNLQRTHLSVSQKACLAAEVQDFYTEFINKGKSIKISKRRNGIPLTEAESKKVTTRDTISKLFRVNGNYCNIAKKLKDYEYDVFTEVKLGRMNLVPQAHDILNQNIEYVLNVLNRELYNELKMKNLDLSESDFILINTEKQKGRNLKNFIDNLIKVKLKDPNEKDLTATQVKIISLSDLGGVENPSVMNETEETNKVFQMNQKDSTEEEMIYEFDNIDKDIKIKIVRQAMLENCTPTYYLILLLNKLAA